MLAAPCLRDDFRADQEGDLDTDAGEPDAVATRLGARGHVVVARQLAPPHAGTVIDNREGRRDGIGGDDDRRGAGIERVRDDLGENRRLGGAGIRVAQVFQQMEQVDPRLAHGRPRVSGRGRPARSA